MVRLGTELAMVLKHTLQLSDIGSSTCDNGKMLDAYWEVVPFGGGNKLFEREDQYGDSAWACWYDSLVATKIVKEELVHVAMSLKIQTKMSVQQTATSTVASRNLVRVLKPFPFQ